VHFDLSTSLHEPHISAIVAGWRIVYARVWQPKGVRALARRRAMRLLRAVCAGVDFPPSHPDPRRGAPCWGTHFRVKPSGGLLPGRCRHRRRHHHHLPPPPLGPTPLGPPHRSVRPRSALGPAPSVQPRARLAQPAFRSARVPFSPRSVQSAFRSVRVPFSPRFWFSPVSVSQPASGSARVQRSCYAAYRLYKDR
jgi:hypothetical protein